MTTGAPSRAGRGQRAAAVGLLVNVALAGVKLVAGLVGHSGALVADAVESLIDIAGSVVVWGGLHIAAKPADPNHPYGHGKAEALAGLAVAGIVALAGIGIGAEAIHAIITPHEPPRAWTLAVLVGVVAVKETMFRVVRRIARQTGSGAVEADAVHHRADAITSAAAFVGICCAIWLKYPPADDWAALAAALVILYNGWTLARTPLAELMDADTAGVGERAADIAMKVDGVRDVQKALARKSGGGYWIDMHVRVDPELKVAEAHAISHRVKDAVRAGLPDVHDVLIHIEPFDERFAVRRAGGAAVTDGISRPTDPAVTGGADRS